MSTHNFAMFSDEGNSAVERAIKQLINEGPVAWSEVITTLEGLPFKEVTDTAVRDEVLEYLGDRRMLSDIKRVAIHPERYPMPLPIC